MLFTLRVSTRKHRSSGPPQQPPVAVSLCVSSNERRNSFINSEQSPSSGAIPSWRRWRPGSTSKGVWYSPILGRPEPHSIATRREIVPFQTE